MQQQINRLIPLWLELDGKNHRQNNKGYVSFRYWLQVWTLKVANDKSCQNITLDASCLLCDLRKNLAVVEASEFTSSWPSAIVAGISVLIILQKTCWTSIKLHVRRQYLCDGWHHASKEASSQSDCLQETSWLLTKTHFISNMLTTSIGPLQPSQLSVHIVTLEQERDGK